MPGRNDHHQAGEAINVATLAQTGALHFEQVECLERVAHCFAVDENIEGDVFDRFTDRVWYGDDQSPAVDASDGVALFVNHESAAVVLFLKAVGGVGQQMAEFALIDGVEQLTADATVASFVA